MHRFGPVALVLVAIVGIGAIGGALAGFGFDVGPGTHAATPTAGAAVAPAASDDAALAVLQVRAEASVDATEANRSVTVMAHIQNTAANVVNETLVLRIDEDRDGELETTLEKRPITVPAGAAVQVNFSVRGDRFWPGRYTYGIGNAEGTAYWTTGDFVLEPASFDLLEVSDPTTVRGEPASISATVANVGDFEGAEPVTLVIGADRVRFGGHVAGRMTKSVTVPPHADERVAFEVDTAGLPAGSYPFRLETPSAVRRGTLRVLQPATYRIDAVNSTPVAVRGERINLSVTVTNHGDVAGTKPVTLAGIEPLAQNRTVALAPGETRTVDIAVNTSPLGRGNYTFHVATAVQTVDVPLRVRAPEFAVTDLRGRETLTVGDDLAFRATIVNTGDAAGTQTVELKLDLDDDDRPESYNLTERVTLAPDERTTVRFTVPGAGPGDSTSARDLVGTHVYGIFTEDANATGVFAVKHEVAGGDSGSTGPGDRATRDEISQEKYGRYYAALSEETQQQVDELYRRQPFANGLAVTEVLTREEIARQRYGVDVEPGEPFDFAALDVELQQRIEAVFDAQFESQAGDRIESWDELARARFGTPYDQLAEREQQAIREAYWAQFEDG